jgi:hypothetical protein
MSSTLLLAKTHIPIPSRVGLKINKLATFLDQEHMSPKTT